MRNSKSKSSSNSEWCPDKVNVVSHLKLEIKNASTRSVLHNVVWYTIMRFLKNVVFFAQWKIEQIKHFFLGAYLEKLIADNHYYCNCTKFSKEQDKITNGVDSCYSHSISHNQNECFLGSFAKIVSIDSCKKYATWKFKY